ncbi:NAD(P)-dependent dehydrogenase, short-chain alcohol dehydrogenase family [Gracilibacillus ureilyticus]|uniref:NAD(P)-dependent dehydrogenase, short-chain alcohol dehydrogenase family n=1 Tax=Gracilibacillus ureilyticus TaxID=531814 RepID=A0A1H9SMZ4_9BACI|nr:SDR family oxidoreductase [Gracilibacillus ureilyticus]SER86356.1 NAD(P)-dependent dehydrogenase, short-chain alcohol dehydrogenase family [Gracilibacillus ureilyticus]
MANKTKEVLPKQHQDRQPGLESEMNPLPVSIQPDYQGADKLKGKTAVITGGDSGIGRAVAIHFAREGANVGIIYFDEDKDAAETKKQVESEGVSCSLFRGDISSSAFCNQVIENMINEYKNIDILVNNAAVQYPQQDFLQITDEQLEKTFRTNIFSYFYLTRAALPHMGKGSTIINTSSITAFQGNESLIDYSSTKGAITTFTKSLAKSLVKKGIRVNSVAPGPIWTPLIPASFDEHTVSIFGSDTEMGRPGEPAELGPAYVYLASDDSSYVTGQTIHVNGGTVI